MIKMAREYRAVFKDGGINHYSNGSLALFDAKVLSRTWKSSCKVQEQHGSRWYTIAEAVGGELVYKGKVNDYYILPVDPTYGQPTGDVETRSMTKAEAILLQTTHGFVFDNYVAAMYRAMD